MSLQIRYGWLVHLCFTFPQLILKACEALYLDVKHEIGILTRAIIMHKYIMNVPMIDFHSIFKLSYAWIIMMFYESHAFMLYHQYNNSMLF